MRYTLLSFLLFFYLHGQSQQPLQAIGMWREHLPYNSAISVTTGNNKVYCATPYSLFSVDLGNKSIERMSRVTGLNETGISQVAYDAANEKLFIAYSNSNIDILQGASIINIPDIKRDNRTGDKTIYSIYSLSGNYFLSTGLGVIVIDGQRNEVKDTWMIGSGGNPGKVNGFTSDPQFYYAATDEGLKKIARNASNPANYANWQLISGTNGLPAGACQHVFTLGSVVIVQHNDELWLQTGSTWTRFYTDGWQINSSNNTANKIQLCEQGSGGASRVVVLNADGSQAAVYAQPGIISFPRQAISINNETWVADQFGGLSHFGGTSFEQYKPNSPESVASGEMTVFNNVFYATAGEVNDAWNYQHNGNGIFLLREGSWKNINRFNTPQLDTLLDFISITVDPRDETFWAGSYGGGLLHSKTGNTLEIFKQGFIGAAIGDPGSYRVSGLCFDGSNNLWIANYGSSQPLKLRKADGSWQSFSIPFFLNENAVGQIINGENDYKWIVSPKGNGLLCYDAGSSLDNTGDDHWKLFRAGAGNGNLPTNDVYCAASDKNGYVWVGTGDGIAVIQCPADIFTGTGCEAMLPVVMQGGFANYLFKGQVVRAIAVDGADRKWVATKSGVWLISADGEEIIYQFTETNSPILNNDVKKIAIDDRTGEVFFATLKGICSYRSTATSGNEIKQTVRVFPNPVPPGFAGTIAIQGVVNNAIVKITELDGRLVYQCRALGGQAVWDGRDYKGRKISSGVYLILVSDDEKKEKLAGKIIFVGK